MNVTPAPTAAPAAITTPSLTSASGNNDGTGFADLLAGELGAVSALTLMSVASGVATGAAVPSAALLAVADPTTSGRPAGEDTGGLGAPAVLAPPVLASGVATGPEVHRATVLAVADPSPTRPPAAEVAGEPVGVVGPAPSASAATPSAEPAAALPQLVAVTPTAADNPSVDPGGTEDFDHPVGPYDPSDPADRATAIDVLGAGTAPLLAIADVVASPVGSTAPALSAVPGDETAGPAPCALPLAGALHSTGDQAVSVDKPAPGSATPLAAPDPATTPPVLAMAATAPVPITAATTEPVTPVTAGPAVPRDLMSAQVLPVIARAISHGEGVQRLVLRLHPADLGEVRVTMTVRDGSVDLTLTAGAQARHHLAQGSGELRQMLELVGASAGQIVLRDPVTGIVPVATGDAPNAAGTGGSNTQDPNRTDTSASSDRQTRDHGHRHPEGSGTHGPVGSSPPRPAPTSARSLDLTL